MIVLWLFIITFCKSTFIDISIPQARFNMFASTPGGTDDAIFKVYAQDERGRILGSEGPSYHAEVTVFINEPGQYTFCVESLVPQVRAKLGFVPQIPLEVQTKNGLDVKYIPLSNDTLRHFLHATSNVVWSMAISEDYVKLYTMYLDRDEEILEHTLFRITSWTFTFCAVAVGSSMVQVWFIRNMFKYENKFRSCI